MMNFPCLQIAAGRYPRNSLKRTVEVALINKSRIESDTDDIFSLGKKLPGFLDPDLNKIVVGRYSHNFKKQSLKIKGA